MAHLQGLFETPMPEEVLTVPPVTPTNKGAEVVARVCDGIIRWTVLALAALMPVFVLPWTIEVVEINKQLLLLVGAALAGLAWLGRMLALRRFEYRRTVVNVMVTLFLVVYAVSAWLSYSPYMSVMGDFGQEKAGLSSVLAMAILYFVVANNLRTMKEVRAVIMAVLVGGFLAGLYALLQGFGLFVLPFEFAKSSSFNTIGTATALGIYMAFVTALAGGLIMIGHGREPGQAAAWRNRVATVFISLTGVLGLFLAAAIDYWPVTVCLALASAVLIGFAFLHAKDMKGIAGVLLPIASLVVCLLILFFSFPVTLKYPAEVMPSLKASADITVKTLREKAFFGSGPGTFIFDYAKHHDAEVNQTAFWDTRFDRSSNRFMTMMATTGLLGTLSWLAMALFLLVVAARRLLKADEGTWHALIGIFAAWLPLVLVRFVYSSTITLEFAFWLLMGLMVAVMRLPTFSVSFEKSPRAAMSVSFVFILGAVFVCTGLFVEGTRYAGEISYAKAISIDRAGGKVEDVVNGLAKAANLNPRNDVYVRNLALAALARANQTLTTEPTVERQEGEKDEDYDKRVETARQDQVRLGAQMAAESVNIAKAATDINGKNVANWSVLGSVYSSLVGVTEGADEWAVKSYEQAIGLEPANPVLRTDLGKIYFYQAGVARQAAANLKDDAKKEAEAKAADFTVKAEEAFNKAIELKADYAPARYNLSLTLDSEGKLKEAITKMEEVVPLSPKDVGVGFQLGLMYFRDGRKDDAVNLMEAVVRFAPNFANARWYLAAMYEDKGDVPNLDKAIEQLKKILENNQDNDLVKRKLDELNQKKAGIPPVAVGPDGQPLPPPVDQPTKDQNQPGVSR
jgi:tetratricopeptide (TPR) repeat protein